MTPQARGFAFGLLAVCLFGASLPMTRLAVAALDPWFVTSARAALAGLLAATWIGWTKPRRPLGRQWRDLAAVALCLVVGFPLLMALGMRLVPAAHGGVVLGVLPLATAAAAAALGFERPSARFWAVAALGTVLVVAFALREGQGIEFALGDLYLGVAVGVCGIGYAVSARLSSSLGGPGTISWALVLVLPAALPAALALAPADPAAVPPSSWLGLVYVAAISQWLGFFAWNKGLALGGTSRVGQTQLLQIFVTIAISAALLGEAVGVEMLVFAAAVAGTVMFARRAPVERN